MSVGPYAGPVQRVSVDGSLTELFRRVEALERVRRTAGDYVFLDQQQPDVDGAIVFSAIDQTYEHLVIEASLFQDSGSDGDALEDLWVQWGPDAGSIYDSGYVSGAVRYFSADNPTAAEGLHVDNLTSDAAVVIPGVVPSVSTDGGAGTSVTIKVPFYTMSAADSRPKTCIVQAVTFPYTPDDGIERAVVFGGGTRDLGAGFTDETIGAISLNAAVVGVQGLDPRSVASLYGIKGLS